jgi:hypothetical protein
MKMTLYSGFLLLVLTGIVVAGWLRPRAVDLTRAAAPVALATAREAGSNRTSFGARTLLVDDARKGLLRALRELAPSPAHRARPGDSAAAPLPTPEVLTTGEPVESTNEVPLDETLQYVLAGMHEVLPMIKDCYAGDMPQSGEGADNLSLRFVVEGDAQSGGVVTNSEVLGLDAKQKNLATCVTETVYAAKFDPPAQGNPMTVEMSFNPRHLPED